MSDAQFNHLAQEVEALHRRLQAQEGDFTFDMPDSVVAAFPILAQRVCAPFLLNQVDRARVIRQYPTRREQVYRLPPVHSGYQPLLADYMAQDRIVTDIAYRLSAILRPGEATLAALDPSEWQGDAARSIEATVYLVHELLDYIQKGRIDRLTTSAQ